MSGNVRKSSDIPEPNESEDYGIYKRYIGIWEQPNALDILLDVVGSDEYIYKLTTSSFKKKHVWEEIAARIESRGVLLGHNPCRVAYQKWLNLKKNFISIINKKGPTRMPSWFGKMNDVFEKSEGKLLGNSSLQGEEDSEEPREPALKKVKQELISPDENSDIHVQIDPGQYVIEEVGQVSYGDVIAIMQQLEVERRDREEAREKREKERFDKLADLIRQQNTLTEKLINVLSKQSAQTEPRSVLPLDPSVCIIATENMRR